MNLIQQNRNLRKDRTENSSVYHFEVSFLTLISYFASTINNSNIRSRVCVLGLFRFPLSQLVDDCDGGVNIEVSVIILAKQLVFKIICNCDA